VAFALILAFFVLEMHDFHDVLVFFVFSEVVDVPNETVQTLRERLYHVL
jgi:hypothetical protein